MEKKQNSMTHSSKTNEDRYSETLLMRIQETKNRQGVLPYFGILWIRPMPGYYVSTGSEPKAFSFLPKFKFKNQEKSTMSEFFSLFFGYFNKKIWQFKNQNCNLWSLHLKRNVRHSS